jgi:hypothetical protein
LGFSVRFARRRDGDLDDAGKIGRRLRALGAEQGGVWLVVDAAVELGALDIGENDVLDCR